jgi:DNA-binding MarR family transcriptional regulator
MNAQVLNRMMADAKVCNKRAGLLAKMNAAAKPDELTPSARRVLRNLSGCDRKAGSISEGLDMPISTASAALRLMQERGMVVARKDAGKIWSITDAGRKELEA